MNEVAPANKVLERAMEIGKGFAGENLDRDTLRQLKNGLNYSAIKALSEPEIYYAKL